MASSSVFNVGNASASEILAHMAAVYACSATYADTGDVRTTFVGNDRSHTSVRRFATAFDRVMCRFRFEYRERRGDDSESSYVVSRVGAIVQTWWDVRPGVREEDSLGIALAGATGVSGGSAHTVPVLLLPDEVGGRSLVGLVGSPVRFADEAVDGTVCFRVNGVIPMTDDDGDQISVFIDQHTFLVRQIVVWGLLSGDSAVKVESITVYDAETNGVVPDAAFEFLKATGNNE